MDTQTATVLLAFGLLFAACLFCGSVWLAHGHVQRLENRLSHLTLQQAHDAETLTDVLAHEAAVRAADDEGVASALADAVATVRAWSDAKLDATVTALRGEIALERDATRVTTNRLENRTRDLSNDHNALVARVSLLEDTERVHDHQGMGMTHVHDFAFSGMDGDRAIERCAVNGCSAKMVFQVVRA